jgi:hypothetical protein
MSVFFMKYMRLVADYLFFLILLAFCQSLIACYIAQSQAAFFQGMSVKNLPAAIFYSYVVMIISRALLIFMRQSLTDYAAIICYSRSLQNHAVVITARAQDAQIICRDLSQWSHGLLELVPTFFQELTQIIIFWSLLQQALRQISFSIILMVGLYVVATNSLTYLMQRYALILERRFDKIEGYWHAILYQRQTVSVGSLQRYQKNRIKIFCLKRVIILSDIILQTIALLLPALVLSQSLLAGRLGVEDYVILSQISFNVLPAVTHFALYRARWAQVWSCGKRFYELCGISRNDRSSAQSTEASSCVLV